jgi:hypothetical protein
VTSNTDEVRRLFAAAGPRPHGDLRARCLPAAAASDRNDDMERLWREEMTMQRKRRYGRGAGLVAASGLIVALVWLFPGSTRVAGAAIFEEILGALDGIAAVHVTMRTDEGPRTVASAPSELWVVRDLGSRFEEDGRAEIYSVVRGQKSWFDRGRGRVEVVTLEDRLMVRELLRRARAEENVHVLAALAAREAGAVRDELVELDDGTVVRRLAGADERGRPLLVEIDPDTWRVLRTEAWTVESDAHPSVRVVTQYDYPDPDGLDPALFDPVPREARDVVRVMATAQARMQAMTDLRDLAMMVMLYARDHDGLLPAGVRDLEPYGEGPLADPLSCAVPGRAERARVISHLHRLPVRRDRDLDPGTVLFECRLPDGTVLCFGDGHVEFRSE